jgi:very-short-patch-repair endonuclease
MNNNNLKKLAKHLRQNSTDAERRLWLHLRASKLGYKFKRQAPIGNFIVDFVCLEKKIIIELDGGQHNQNNSAEAKRTAYLNQNGFRVLRYWNHAVLQYTDCVLEEIYNILINKNR